MLDKDFYIKNGLIYAVVTIVYLVITYLVGVSFMVSFWNMGIALILSLGLMVYMGLEVRKAKGGYLSFGDGFKSIMVVYALGAFLYVLFNYVLSTVIDPSLPGKMANQSVELAMSMMESMGTPEDVMEQEYDKIAAQREDVLKGFTPLGLITNYFISVAFGSIIALVASAITKKNNPNPFDEVNA